MAQELVTNYTRSFTKGKRWEVHPNTVDGNGNGTGSYGDRALSPGRLRIRHLSDNTKMVSNSQALTGKILEAISEDFSCNVYDIDKNTFWQRSPHSIIAIDTDAGKLQIACNVAVTGADGIFTVLDANRNPVAFLKPTSTIGLQTLLTHYLPGNGVRRFYIVEPAATQDAGGFKGTYITSVTGVVGALSGVSGNIQESAPAAKDNRLIVVADSIFNGDGTTANSLRGPVPVLRKKLGETWDVCIDGWGWRSNASLNTPAARQEQADRIIAFLQGASGRQVLMHQVLTNDYGTTSETPTAVTGYAADVWARVKAVIPNLEVIAPLAIARGDEYDGNGVAVPNGSGHTMQAFRDAMAAKCTEIAYATSYNWASLLPVGNAYYDPAEAVKIHPNDIGANKIAREAFRVITSPASALPTRILSDEVVSCTDDRISASSALTYFDSYSVPDTPGRYLPPKSGGIRFSNAAVEVLIPFTGEYAELQTFREPGNNGIWRAYVDEVQQATDVNLYEAAWNYDYKYATTPVPYGDHVLKLVRVSGTAYIDQIAVFGNAPAQGQTTPTTTNITAYSFTAEEVNA